MVWMNPFFESPLVDNGYDVADYRAIHPRYGTMEDFQQMIDGFHKREIKFVLDVVVNHSSKEHEWFKQASSSEIVNTMTITIGGQLKRENRHIDIAYLTQKEVGIMSKPWMLIIYLCGGATRI